MTVALVQHRVPTTFDTALAQGVAAVHAAADAGADLVVFPELAFTPFYPRRRLADWNATRADLAEPVPGPTTEALADAAREREIVVVANVYEQDGARFYDTSPVIDADGTLCGLARMMHITQYEGFWEQDYYDPGDTGAPVFDTAAGRIGVAICYDRHFPEYMRALGLQNADLVVVPQAGVAGEWPGGMYEAELRVAAFQNGYFVALANRVGAEEGLAFNGASFVASPTGRLLAQAPEHENTLLTATLDLEERSASPARQLFVQHRRPDQYEGGAVASARASQEA